MFGYVTANEPELKVKDFQRYKAYYCGLCHILKEKYGQVGQLTLTYDMTFLILVLTSLYENETKAGRSRCKIHPVKPQTVLQNEITEYAADLNLILAYYHMKDDWQDENQVSGFLGTCILRRRVKKAVKKYPRQSRAIQKELKALARYEKENTAEIDKPAGCFGRLMAELFVYKKDRWEETLRRMAFYLGKFIYIMDACDDLEKDLQSGSYNPLRGIAAEKDYEERCRQMLCMMMGECTAEFEKLPLVLDIDILRNILYDGVWKRYRKLYEQKSEESRS